jgi:hypothetical protein
MMLAITRSGMIFLPIKNHGFVAHRRMSIWITGAVH